MDILENNNEVEPSYLADVIRKRCSKVLVIDTRSFIDYNRQHIRSSVNAFYSKIIRRRILNSKDCAESILNHLSRGFEDTILLNSFNQLTLVLYGNGYETDKKLSNFRFSSTTSANLPSCFALRRSASEDTSAASLLESNNFITVLLEQLQKTNIFTNVLLLRGGFIDFRRKFPELCESSTQLLNTPQTPCLPSFNTFSESASCRLDASSNKCAKLQQPNSTMKTMSNSTSHPCLGNSTYKAMCSSEGSSPNAQITQVLDFVFLGSKDDAQDPETLTRNGITKVINLSDCPKSDLIQNDSHHFMRIPVKDSYDAKLIPYFDQAYDFIEEARKTNQRVLVHCLAGISRSPTLAIAYIMKAKRLTCDEAYKFVKTRRPTVSPNLNFMGQLFEYEKHLRGQSILPDARPRSNVIDDYIPPATTKETMTVVEPSKAPMLVTEKLCKSASADFSLLSNDTNAENRRRLMDTPFSLPCRPRQLIKNCCTRKNLENQPQQLPSPSTEFSKLDISLSNPCFGTNTNSLAFDSQFQQPQTSTQTNAENPVFGLTDNKNDKAKTAKKPVPNHHQLLNLFSRRPNNYKLPATARFRCKLSKCYSRNSGQKPSQLTIEESNRPNGIENVRYRMPRFSRLPARNHVNIMPTLHDDEVDSGKGSSVSHSVSTEDGECLEQSDTLHSAISPTQSATDPERESISSASSLEISVQ